MPRHRWRSRLSRLLHSLAEALEPAPGVVDPGVVDPGGFDLSGAPPAWADRVRAAARNGGLTRVGTGRWQGVSSSGEHPWGQSATPEPQSPRAQSPGWRSRIVRGPLVVPRPLRASSRTTGEVPARATGSYSAAADTPDTQAPTPGDATVTAPGTVASSGRRSAASSARESGAPSAVPSPPTRSGPLVRPAPPRGTALTAPSELRRPVPDWFGPEGLEPAPGSSAPAPGTRSHPEGWPATPEHAVTSEHAVMPEYSASSEPPATPEPPAAAPRTPLRLVPSSDPATPRQHSATPHAPVDPDLPPSFRTAARVAAAPAAATTGQWPELPARPLDAAPQEYPLEPSLRRLTRLATEQAAT